MQFAKDSDGVLRSLPFSVDYWILYWNKELFEAKGLKYPQTFDELVAAAEAITDPSTNTYGFVARGLKNANTPVWTSLMLGYGAAPIVNGKIDTTTREAVEAAKLYQRLMTKSAPRVFPLQLGRSAIRLPSGKIGMWFDGVGFAPPIENPEKSRVVGKAGYGVMPKGPAQQAAGTFGDGLGVVEASTKKGSCLPVLPMGHFSRNGRASVAGRCGRPVPPVQSGRREGSGRRQDACRMAGRRRRFRQGVQACPSRHHSRYRVPRYLWRWPHQHDRRGGPGNRTQEGDRAVRTCSGTQRGIMVSVSIETAASAKTVSRRSKPTRLASQLLAFRHSRTRRHCSGHRVSVGVHTWMSAPALDAGSGAELHRFGQLYSSGQRCAVWESLWHTLVYTIAVSCRASVSRYAGSPSVRCAIPIARLPARRLRHAHDGNSVAIALVWTMMFHPQLGVLNYLLSLIGIGPLEWIYNQSTVIPSLVLVGDLAVDTACLAIVLGGLAAVPREPYESAEIDGANAWQEIPLPDHAHDCAVSDDCGHHPLLDAVKSFDIIYAMTQGGPARPRKPSTSISYNTAFAYYDIGYGQPWLSFSSSSSLPCPSCF